VPDIFKALASITAWILWICGLAMAVITLIAMSFRDVLFSSAALGLNDAVAFALAAGMVFLAVVVMLIRNKLE
jgi:hypothetical protein